MYQRVITLTFKDELSKEAITNYLQPVIKEQGEAYGLIAMTCAQINELSVVDTYYWPDYDTKPRTNMPVSSSKPLAKQGLRSISRRPMYIVRGSMEPTI